VATQVAVAVVSWNTRDLLAACLTSLEEDKRAGRAEVWVVDNGSSDGSPDLVRTRFPWVELVEPGENLGFGRAVNLIADRTAAPWIAPANADVRLEPGALGTLLATGERDPRAGAVAPQLITLDGTPQHSVYAFPTVPFSIVRNFPVGRISPRLADRLCFDGYWDASRARRVDWAIGAFMILRRSGFDEVGGFDPAQWMYAEDLDLGWRLAEAGWTTLYEPAARVHHAVSAATEVAFGDEKTERWIEASYETIARRRGLTRASAVGALNAAGSAVRWAALAPLQAVAPKRYRESRERARWWAGLHAHGIRTAWASRRR
jgi:N-acetylglucosaminyl-diphospho-decaprenol L-rhamnosyltransferase